MKPVSWSMPNLSRLSNLAHPSALRYLAVGTVAFGMLLRIWQYFIDRSLWFDEAMLALNIVGRSFGGLTQPLDYSQGAPFGFLFVEKAAIYMLGNRDHVLRLLPIISGVAAMLLIYEVANLYLEGTGIFVAVLAFAVSDRLIYYASEAKQYSCDVAISLVLLWFAYKCLKRDSSPRHFGGLALVGLISMWMSHPASFTLGAIGFSLLSDRLLKKDWRRLSWLGLVFLVWVASFTGLYYVSLRVLATNSILVKYWRNYFMPMPPWQDLAWFPESFARAIENPAGLSFVWISAIFFLIGSLSLFFKRWQTALILFLPFPAVLLASGLEKYPFGDRLLLFIVPSMFMIIAEGLERARWALSKVNRWVALGTWTIVLLLLAYNPTNLALHNLAAPPMREEIKPVMSYVHDHELDNDLVYVYYGAMPAFKYYAPQYSFSEADYVIGVTSRNRPAKYFKDVKSLEGQGRVWFIFSHNCSWCIVNEEAYYLDNLNKMGAKLDEYMANGASAYLFYLEKPKQ
ncbi:MAG: glycosyltransferase family 39 protein [Anaerolineales bacterium]